MDAITPDLPADERIDWAELARTGPDTLGGRYLRRFWTPVYRSAALASGHAKPIRIMCEDFTLYRSDSGTPHIIDARCPDLNPLLNLGWIEGEDIQHPDLARVQDAAV